MNRFTWLFEKNKILMLLSIILIAGFFLRFYQSYSTGHIVGVDGYYHLRIAELYRSGNFSNLLVYPPGNQLMIAVMNLFTGISLEFSAMVLSALFSTLAILGVFLMIREKVNEKAGIFAALFIAFSAQAVSYGSLVKNLNFSLAFIAFGLWLNEKKMTVPFSIVVAALALFSPIDAAVLAFLSMLSFLVPSIVEKKRPDYKRVSLCLALAMLALFTGTFYLNSSFSLIYITKEIPSSLSSVLFYIPNAQDFFLRISPMLLIFGILGIAKSVGDKKSLELVIAVALLSLLFPFGILETDRWYVYANLFLSAFSGIGFLFFWDYFRQRKMDFLPYLSLALVLVISVVSIPMALDQNSWGLMNKERYYDYDWLRYNTPENSVVLGTIYESHWIVGISHRNPVSTANLIEEPGFGKYYEDITLMYNTTDQNLRKSLLNHYNVSYVILSDKSEWQFGNVSENFKSQDFEIAYNNGDFSLLRYQKS
jgi:asparagine N-glycosylation enzyme membrane subunit Stt3